MPSQLLKIHTLEGRLELLTGLHIGAGNQEIHIGGIDNAVIKHPFTDQPYIPGSSLKGRIRSLLEWRAGIVAEAKGKPVDSKTLAKLDGIKKTQAEAIVRLFGISGDADADAALVIGPSRLSFWDAFLTEDWVNERLSRNESFTEAKSENFIDRIRGVAEHPRQTERVPAGATFSFRLTLKVLDDDNETVLIDTVLAGLRLLELDGIGGSSSRGYGKIRFVSLTQNGESLQSRLEQLDPFKLDAA